MNFGACCAKTAAKSTPKWRLWFAGKKLATPFRLMRWASTLSAAWTALEYTTELIKSAWLNQQACAQRIPVKTTTSIRKLTSPLTTFKLRLKSWERSATRTTRLEEPGFRKLIRCKALWETPLTRTPLRCWVARGLSNLMWTLPKDWTARETWSAGQVKPVWSLRTNQPALASSSDDEE